MHTIWLQNWDYVYFKSLRNLSLNKDSSNCASPNVITCQQDEWYTLICQQFPIPVHISQTGQSLNRRHKLDTKNVNIQKQWENISISKNILLLILKSQQFNTKRFEKKAPTWSCWNYLIHISLVVSLNVIGILSEKTCIGLCHIHSIFQYCRGIEIENPLSFLLIFFLPMLVNHYQVITLDYDELLYELAFSLHLLQFLGLLPHCVQRLSLEVDMCLVRSHQFYDLFCPSIWWNALQPSKKYMPQHIFSIRHHRSLVCNVSTKWQTTHYVKCTVKLTC